MDNNTDPASIFYQTLREIIASVAAGREVLVSMRRCQILKASSRVSNAGENGFQATPDLSSKA
jgi:hypothetical protein